MRAAYFDTPSASQAAAIAAHCVHASVFVIVQPMRDGDYRVYVTREAEHFLPAAYGYQEFTL